MAPREDVETAASERSWLEYRRLVLEGLERIERRLTEMDAKVDREISLIDSKVERESATQRKDISDLKVQVGALKVWATLSGVLAAAVMSAVVQLVFKR